MDIATLLGIGLGLALTVISILVAEGVKGFAPFLNAEAFLVVMGGTMCALFVNYPMKQVLSVFKVLKKTMLSTEEEDMTHIIASFVDLSKKARTDGFLALENDVRGMKNDFLRRGVQMVVDGLDKEFIANMLETEIDLSR